MSSVGLARWPRRWDCLVALAMAAAVPAALDAQQQRPDTASLVFDGVAVVDVEHGTSLPDQRVVIIGNRIQAVGSRGTVRAPEGAFVVDAKGKYLIPGFWDMHVHVENYPAIMYPLFIANGVTGVREMSQHMGLDSLHRWRREIAAGARIGPRILGTGPLLESRADQADSATARDDSIHLLVDTPERGRRVVDSLQAAGADFIKMHSAAMPRVAYFAVLAEGRRRGLPVVGHLSGNVTAIEAADSGQRSFEHLAGARSCWQETAEGETACAAMAQHLRQHRAWMVPTLMIAYGNQDSALAARYWPDSVFAIANRDFGPARSLLWSIAADDLRRAQRGVAALHRLGVPMLAGTDAAPNVPEDVPGFALHHELALLVEAGLTPLEALQAATRHPAEFFGMTDSLGSIGEGKVADLVLLDANPLDDIKNSTKIRAVVANGRYFDRAALDGLLEAVERAAHR